jgi:CRISPR-associated protein Cas1
MRLASTLLAHKGGTRVGLDHGALMVRATDGTKSRVPLESVDGVLLVGGASMTTEAIARCISSGVRVSSLTRSGRVRFVCQPATAGNVHLRVAQLRCADSEAAALELARWIVAGKLANSLRLIRRWASDEPEAHRTRLDRAIDGVRTSLERVAETPTADHLRGVEGNAARWHFVAMGLVLHRLGLPFTMLRRSRRPPGDPLNAAISFGYGVLTAELVGAADVVGLDPQIGFLHGVRSGRPALALDVLEEMRAGVIDRFVIGSLRRRQLRLEHFVETPGGGWYLTEEGRRQYFSLFEEFRAFDVQHDLLGRPVPRWTLPVVQMTVLARFLRGDLPVYVPWQGR